MGDTTFLYITQSRNPFLILFLLFNVKLSIYAKVKVNFVLKLEEI